MGSNDALAERVIDRLRKESTQYITHEFELLLKRIIHEESSADWVGHLADVRRDIEHELRMEQRRQRREERAWGA